MSDSERNAKIAEIDAIGAKAKAMLDSLPTDSPLRGLVFQVCAMTGRIQAELAASPNLEIIDVVKAYQANQHVHPLTCGNDSLHENLVPFVDDGRVRLMCNECDWRQNVPSWLALSVVSGRSE